MPFSRTDLSTLMRCYASSQVIRRSDIGVAIVEVEKIDVPHGRNSLPTLLAELRETRLRLNAFCRQTNKGGLPPEAEGDDVRAKIVSWQRPFQTLT